jgi:hypothetical protein
MPAPTRRVRCLPEEFEEEKAATGPSGLTDNELVSLYEESELLHKMIETEYMWVRQRQGAGMFLVHKDRKTEVTNISVIGEVSSAKLGKLGNFSEESPFGMESSNRILCGKKSVWSNHKI